MKFVTFVFLAMSLPFLATACSKTAPCREGSILLSVNYGPQLRDLDEVHVTVIRNGMPGQQQTIAHKQGGLKDVVNVTFTSYPAGEEVKFVAQGFRNGAAVSISMESPTVTLAPNCDHIEIDISQTDSIFDGGTDMQGSLLDGGTTSVCSDGFFDHDQDLSTECIAWKECPSGTFIVTPGTSSQDRVCRGCATGYFSSQANATECNKWTDCIATEYIVKSGDSERDRQCAACPDGTFTDAPNSGACAEVGKCPAGKEQIMSATSSAGAKCAACDLGTYCAGGTATKQACAGSTWDHDSNAASPCAAKSNCVAGQMVSDQGSPIKDRSCVECPVGNFSSSTNATECIANTICPAGQYIKQPATTTASQVCTECPSSTFSSQSNALACALWKTCEMGTYVANQPSMTVDRVCASCASGTYTAGTNQTSCVAQGDCAAGTEKTVAATASSPAVCVPCPAGTYCAGASATKTTCGGETWDHDGRSDTACVSKSTCSAGQYVTSNGSATENRLCVACSGGTFSSGTNAAACVAWLDCPASQFISAAGSSTSDRACADCKSGEFSTNKNVAACTLWTDCQPGKRVSNTPSKSADRICLDCAAGEYTSQPNQQTCQTQNSCNPGTVQTVAGTKTMPPMCAICEAGTYCAGGTASKAICVTGTWDNDLSSVTPCVAKAVCAAGTASASEGTTTTDRDCSLCASSYKKCNGSCVANTYCCTSNGDDCSSPKIASIDPADGADGIPANQVIRIVFSKNMNRASVEQAYSSSELPSGDAKFSWTDDKHFVITPNAPLSYGKGNVRQIYSISFASAKDSLGLSLAAFSSSFKTLTKVVVPLSAIPTESGTTQFNYLSLTDPTSRPDPATIDVDYQIPLGGSYGIGMIGRGLVSFDLLTLPSYNSRSQIVKAQLSLTNVDNYVPGWDAYAVGKSVQVLYERAFDVKESSGRTIVYRLPTTTAAPIATLSPATIASGVKSASVIQAATDAWSNPVSAPNRLRLGLKFQVESPEAGWMAFSLSDPGGTAPTLDIEILRP